MINTYVVRLWINNLRSGNYRQARGQLRSPQDEFCCLGVLCDLTEPGAWHELAGESPPHKWKHHAGRSMPSDRVKLIWAILSTLISCVT